MIIDPIDAPKMRCCTQERQCLGPQCMAWRKEFVRAPNQTPVHPLSVRFQESGNGYCGIAYPK